MKALENLFPATAMPDSDWWQALWPDPLEVLKKIGMKKGMTAVGLCCGDRLFTAPMSILLDGKVYAVDLDSKMLTIAKQTAEATGAPPCNWVEGDARDMVRLIPEKVDTVLIANTFHGVTEQTELARGARNILKSGGTFVVINWHVTPREETFVLGEPRGPRTKLRMSPEDVSEVVETAGFQLGSVIKLPPYHYAAIFIAIPERG